MTKSTITRERIQRIIRAINSEAYDEEEIREWLSSDEIMELSRMALAAMDSEPVGKPFMYGIADPDGNAYIDEFCVSEDLGLVEDTVNELNYDREEGDELNYSVVALYRHAQPAPVVPGKWIPVSERMPEAEGHYLVWANASRIDGYCDHLEIAAYQGMEWSNEFNWLVTHWMPLPAAPQEVK